MKSTLKFKITIWYLQITVSQCKTDKKTILLCGIVIMAIIVAPVTIDTRLL